jgi:hypothetical protein
MDRTSSGIGYPQFDADRLALGLQDVHMVELTYLDLDHDGVPDAVHTTSVLRYAAAGDGRTDFVETIEELATDIDDAGEPGHLARRDIVSVDFDHHGDPRVVHDHVTRHVTSHVTAA